MWQQLLLVASCPALLHANSLHEYGSYSIVQEDIEVPTSGARGATALASTNVVDRETYAKPTCVASVATGKLIPHSRLFGVKFSGQYAKAMTMTHDGTDAPAAMVKYYNLTRTSELRGNISLAYVGYKPAASEGGKTRTLSVTFTGSDGAEATCSITVKVAEAENVCLGLPANDPKVCSGRGNCTFHFITDACDCDRHFGGADCSGFRHCLKGYSFPFERLPKDGDGTTSARVSLDSVHKAEGASSLRFGNSTSTEGGFFNIVAHPVMPTVITFFLKRMPRPGPNPVYPDTSLLFRTCIRLDIDHRGVVQPSGLSPVGPEADSWPVLGLDKFHAFRLDLDWSARTYALSVDGGVPITFPMGWLCHGYMFHSYGFMWLDDLQLHCPEVEDECEALPCGMDQTCVDPELTSASLKDFVCTCTNGVNATGAPAACEKDECASKPCGTGQTCNDPAQSASSLKDFVCTCTNGVTATGAAATCEKDECAATPAPCGTGQTCNDPSKAANKLHDFTCTCDADTTISTTDGPATCDKDECKATPCGTGQTCNDPAQSASSLKDFVCTCTNGVTATGAAATCEKDECAATPAPCGTGQTCNDPSKAANKLHDFTCTCDADTTISTTDGPATCDKDECKATPCGTGQTCNDPNKAANKLHDFTCTCDADTTISTTDGPATCDKDECKATPCGTGQTCNDPNKAANKLHDFTCTCDADTTISTTDGPATCDKDECKATPCGTGQTCNDPNKAANKLHDFTCTCDADTTISTTDGPATCDKDERRRVEPDRRATTRTRLRTSSTTSRARVTPTQRSRRPTAPRRATRMSARRRRVERARRATTLPSLPRA